jgi:hypothetical protein
MTAEADDSNQWFTYIFLNCIQNLLGCQKGQHKQFWDGIISEAVD